MMHTRKKRTTTADTDIYNRMWKENPPGLEQKELERLFSDGDISETDSPNSIRLKYPMFREFSTNVFATHFRKTKAKLGLMCM